MKSDAISGLNWWGSTSKLKLSSAHYSSTNDYLHYLLEASLEVRMRATSAWGQGDGHSCLNIVDGNPSGGSLGLVSTVLKAMCFYWETGLTYFSCHSRQVGVATWSFLVLPIDKVHHTLAYIDRNLPVGDNRGTVKTSTTPHISDQLGTENACKTLLCWVIVMIRVLVCNNMYRYKHHFGSFYRNPTILEAVSIHCQ